MRARPDGTMSTESSEEAGQTHVAAVDREDWLASLLRRWDGEEVIIRFDRPSGAWIVIAIHSIRQGRAAGGTRMKRYPHLEAAVDDALRLAAGMTDKFALAGFAWGGGKAVIAIPPDFDEQTRPDLLRRYGDLIRLLGGLYQTGLDVGTSPADMDIIAETGAPYVFCRTPAAGGSGDSGPPTALGVFHGILTTAAWLFGDDSLAGKRVVVQGTGHVGGSLIAHLVAAGAEVLVCDVDAEAARRMHERFGAQVTELATVYDTPCDIFAPCALGGILNRDTIPRLQCRAVVGSANNQLATVDDALRLKERGILYAPDFVVNVGGTMAIMGIEGNGWPREEAERRIVDTVTGTLRQIFDLAATKDITTVDAAERIIGQRRNALR